MLASWICWSQDSLICWDHWNPLVHRLIAQRPFKRSLNFGILHFLRNISTWFVMKCFNEAITMEHFVAYVTHLSYIDAKLSPNQLIVVTHSVTLGKFFPFLHGRKVFFLVKTHFFPSERKKYLSLKKKPNPGYK